ncbi:hypothetical protein PVAND_007400 [Polypedilum vanderplanki]|uniref:Uncharacterized protein n=1 Tax=Polypedilum vanderplanki TaxID=319348 RepID=A0A9J6C6S4_POLVA|nr:hypothetical protein PVAND_007400 [Polypedilum vanderplanki]
MTSNNRTMNWDRYGLDSENVPRSARAKNTSGGFVDLGNESDYARAGHQPSGSDEVFASEQSDKPGKLKNSPCNGQRD